VFDLFIVLVDCLFVFPTLSFASTGRESWGGSLGPDTRLTERWSQKRIVRRWRRGRFEVSPFPVVTFAEEETSPQGRWQAGTLLDSEIPGSIASSVFRPAGAGGVDLDCWQC
jgi:hypothetical protein